MTSRLPSRAAFRPSRRTRRLGPALAWAAAALLAACSGGGDGGTSDTTPPTVTITDDVTAATATGDVTFSFTFSEDVGASFVAADVAVTGGTKGTFTRVASTLYRLVVSPDADTLGTIAVTVPAGAFSDVAGNASAAAATASQAYDTQVALVQMTLPVTFDSTTVAYGLVGFSGADASTIEADPKDASNRVAKVVRSATADPWAGTTVTTDDQSGLAQAIPFDASNTRLTVRVLSPAADVPVRLKVEDHADGTVSVEAEVRTTLAGDWETLTFDFAHPAAGALDLAKTYDKVTVFFDFGVAGATAGEQIYYFDDVAWLGGGGLPTAPAAAPPRPTEPAAEVISLLSDAYTNVPVDTWRTGWSSAVLEEVMVGEDHVKKYSSLDFVGVEFKGANLVDATSMDVFHVDVWTPNATTFKVKLVDFGADADYGGGDDTEHELVFNASSAPALAAGAWVSLDLPLSRFTNLTSRAHLAQLVFAALPTGAATVFVDNVYFHKAAGATAPAAAPARPTQAAADVISLLSDAYTNVPVDTWRTDWSSAALEEVMVGEDHVKKYSSLDFVGVEFKGANLVDATSMAFFHVDVWTPDATTFRVKLVDFGADGGVGGGDDTEHQLAFDAGSTPALAQGSWVSLDLPLASFTNLTGRAHLAQLIFSALPTGAATAFVDNVYFHK